jgi:hypothetical protein
MLCLILAATAAHGLERRPGTIKMSSGEELKGDIWFTDGRLRIYEGLDVADGKYVNVQQSELVSIVFSVKEQSMEKAWRFKNAGSDEKEYTGGEAPLINMKSDTKLASGKTLTGHLMTIPVFIRIKSPDGMDYEDKKFLLKYQHKGKSGEQYKDVIYVASIVFSDAAVAAGENGTISGTVKGVGKLEQVTAVGCERAQSYRAKVDAEKGTYRLADLPKDTYDVAIMTDRGMYVGLSDATLPFKGTPRKLEDEDGRKIAATIGTYRDFFEVQEVLGVKGHREAAKVLVHQLRVGEVNDQKALGTKQQHRLDVWYFHMRTSEWHINDNGRIQLFRYQDEAQGFKRGVQVIEELGNVKLDPAVKKAVEVNLDKSAGGKAPEPPAEGKP